jgi:hypothetical protein
MNIRCFILILGSWLVLGAFCCALAADPEIVGSLRFTNQVHQALVLLRTKDTNAYVIVTNYVGRIQEGARSGMWAYKTPPTYEMSAVTAYYSVTWCAATIAHDAFHSKLYHDHRMVHGGAVPDAVWTGMGAEKQCMKHQLSVMEHIGSSQWEIDYAKKQADAQYTKDKETWQDYQKRKW